MCNDALVVRLQTINIVRDTHLLIIVFCILGRVSEGRRPSKFEKMSRLQTSMAAVDFSQKNEKLTWGIGGKRKTTCVGERRSSLKGKSGATMATPPRGPRAVERHAACRVGAWRRGGRPFSMGRHTSTLPSLSRRMSMRPPCPLPCGNALLLLRTFDYSRV